MNKKRTKRNHDGFFKYVYSDPANARAMLRTLSKGSGSVKRILNNVNLDTLEEISERYDNVDERGEADIAFKATTNTGEPFYFGILLEHKSEHKVNVLEQTFRYAFNVMVDKSNTTFKWLPTKAIIIYNGTDSWDPLAEFRKQPHGNFEGRELPFECAFVDLKQFNDNLLRQSESVEAAIGLMTMKYAFDAKAYSKVLIAMEPLFKKMDNTKGTTLVKKIKLYLGEYITEKALERLNMAFKSLGERLGFVSAGDVRRARERENRNLKARLARKDADLVAKDADNQRLMAENAALRAQLAALQK